jgi:DNA polymerase III epsilon subunit-like protein
MNYAIPAPIYRRRFLVFDVETTGLLPKIPKNAPAPTIDQYPHIIQLSFAVYDLYDRRIVQSYDSYVKLPKSVQISEFVTNLTGITNELCETQGRSIIRVLKRFYAAYRQCEGLVAHNMDFDEKMILIEIERNRDEIIKRAPYCLTMFQPIYEKLNNIDRYCTMRRGTALCNIEMSNVNPFDTGAANAAPKRKKFPKLAELFTKLFETENPPQNLHNSMIDVLVCLKCYLKMRHNIEDKSIRV